MDPVAMALAKPVVTAMAKKAGSILLEKYRKYQEDRLNFLFSCVGDELELGDSREAWDEFHAKINDPKIHAGVVDAARKAIDAFDEAPIPFIAKVVCITASRGSTTLEDRRLIRLLAECDHKAIDAMKHSVLTLASEVEKVGDALDTLQLKLTTIHADKPPSVEAWIAPSTKLNWELDGHDYRFVFEIMKRNYWGSDAPGGAFAGTESGPHILIMEKDKLFVLQRILRDRNGGREGGEGAV